MRTLRDAPPAHHFFGRLTGELPCAAANGGGPSRLQSAPRGAVAELGSLGQLRTVDTNADEIQRATEFLGFSLERFRHLPPDEAQRVYESSLRHFVPRGRPRWWWEHFPSSTGVHFIKGDGGQHLAELVPDADERVWFIAEDFVAPEYSVWEASTRDIQAVIGECYGFEFYVIQQQLRWLVCKNHHAVVVAVGSEVEDRLREYGPPNHVLVSG